MDSHLLTLTVSAVLGASVSFFAGVLSVYFRTRWERRRTPKTRKEQSEYLALIASIAAITSKAIASAEHEKLRKENSDD